MTLVWNQGRQVIEGMLIDGRLEQVPPSRKHADLLIKQARQHLESATARAKMDPEGAYAMLYDAARKALAAVLENQGLRTKSAAGHHANLFYAVVAQLEPPMGADLQPFQRMREQRRNAEYPSYDEPAIDELDVLGDVPKSARIIDICERVLDAMPMFTPRRS